MIRDIIIWMLAFLSPLGSELMAESSVDILTQENRLKELGLSVIIFKNAVFAAKNNNWRKIGHQISKLDNNPAKYKEHFGINLEGSLNKAINKKHAKNVLKLLAYEAFLSMKLQLKVIVDSKIDDDLDSKARLKKGKEGYSEILAGNIKRINQEAHFRVEAAFLDAEIALGSSATNPLMPPSPVDLEGGFEWTPAFKSQFKYSSGFNSGEYDGR